MSRELVEAARRGDRDAFDALVRQEVAGVYRTARAILGSPSDAEEATQDAFVSAWRSLPSLRDVERFDAWLGRIVMNACRMTLRRRRGVREIELDEESGMRSVAGVDPSDVAATADAFDRAFERLSAEDRYMLMLHYRDGVAIADIAARLEIPGGTVKSRLSRARGALDRALRTEGTR